MTDRRTDGQTDVDSKVRSNEVIDAHKNTVSDKSPAMSRTHEQCVTALRNKCLDAFVRQVYEASRQAPRPSAPNSVINKADILPARDRYGMQADWCWM